MTTTGKIVARASHDWLDGSDDDILATVVESNHPRYKAGEKLDWHRIAFSLHDGYTVEIQPAREQIVGECSPNIGIDSSVPTSRD